MLNLNLVTVIASVVIVLAIGYFAKKTKIFKKEDASVLNNVIIYIALPVLIFRGIYSARLIGSLTYIPIIALSITSLLVVIAYLIARILKLDKQLTGTFMLAAAVGNTGYIAYPLLIELFGNKGLVRGIFYDMFGTVIFMLTIGIFICSKFGSSETKPTVIRSFASFPPLYFLILGFAMRGVVLPEVLMKSIDLVANITIGLILIAVGLSLEISKAAKRYLPLISITFLLKLLVAPTLAYILASSFNLQPISMSSVHLSSSMPTALLTLVFGLKFKLNIEFLSSVIFILTIASVVTVPVGQWLLHIAV